MSSVSDKCHVIRIGLLMARYKERLFSCDSIIRVDGWRLDRCWLPISAEGLAAVSVEELGHQGMDETIPEERLPFP